MLASAPGVGYIHEPFNLTVYRPGMFRGRFDEWMTHLTPETGRDYEEAFADALAFRYRYGAALRNLHRPLDLARLVVRGLRYLRYRLTRSRPLMKDPIAIFSAEWLHQKFGMSVVVLIRHPAAFVNSIMRLKWRFDFNHMLSQRELMRDLLAPLESEIREYARAPLTQHALDEAAFLWKVIHHVIGIYQERHPDWIFLRYEDLAADPLPQFEQLFARLGLRFSERARRTIAESTSESNPPLRDDSTPHVTRLDSRQVSRSWTRKLSAEEIARVRAITAPYAERYYTDAEW